MAWLITCFIILRLVFYESLVRWTKYYRIIPIARLNPDRYIVKSLQLRALINFSIISSKWLQRRGDGEALFMEPYCRRWRGRREMKRHFDRTSRNVTRIRHASFIRGRPLSLGANRYSWEVRHDACPICNRYRVSYGFILSRNSRTWLLINSCQIIIFLKENTSFFVEKFNRSSKYMEFNSIVENFFWKVLLHDFMDFYLTKCPISITKEKQKCYK